MVIHEWRSRVSEGPMSTLCRFAEKLLETVFTSAGCGGAGITMGALLSSGASTAPASDEDDEEDELEALPDLDAEVRTKAAERLSSSGSYNLSARWGSREDKAV